MPTLTLPANAIEISEPVRDQDIHCGTFTFADSTGQIQTREFYVRTCVSESIAMDSGHHNSIRENDLNQQLMDAYALLSGNGATAIQYVDIKPSPIF